jgi:hypothetical protein
MKRACILLTLSLLSAAPMAAAAENATPAKPIKVAIMCFSTGEQVSGMNKICYYDCLGSAVAITVSSVSLCPLSINR